MSAPDESVALRAVARLRAGESREAIEADFAKQIGGAVIWHGYEGGGWVETVRFAIAALRAAAGFPMGRVVIKIAAPEAEPEDHEARKVRAAALVAGDAA